MEIKETTAIVKRTFTITLSQKELVQLSYGEDDLLERVHEDMTQLLSVPARDGG